MSIRRQLRDRRGFTLVEVLVAGGIPILVIGVTAGIILASMGGFSRTAQMSEAKQLGLAVYDYYQNRLVEAMEVSINTDIADRTGALAISGEGRLQFDDGSGLADLYNEDVYNNMTLRVNARVNSVGYALDLKVEVLNREGGVSFVKESSFRCNNLKRRGETISGSAEYSQNPIIYYQ